MSTHYPQGFSRPDASPPPRHRPHRLCPSSAPLPFLALCFLAATLAVSPAPPFPAPPLYPPIPRRQSALHELERILLAFLPLRCGPHSGTDNTACEPSKGSIARRCSMSLATSPSDIAQEAATCDARKQQTLIQWVRRSCARRCSLTRTISVQEVLQAVPSVQSTSKITHGPSAMLRDFRTTAHRGAASRSHVKRCTRKSAQDTSMFMLKHSPAFHISEPNSKNLVNTFGNDCDTGKSIISSNVVSKWKSWNKSVPTSIAASIRAVIVLSSTVRDGKKATTCSQARGLLAKLTGRFLHALQREVESDPIMHSLGGKVCQVQRCVNFCCA